MLQTTMQPPDNQPFPSANKNNDRVVANHPTAARYGEKPAAQAGVSQRCHHRQAPMTNTSNGYNQAVSTFL